MGSMFCSCWRRIIKSPAVALDAVAVPLVVPITPRKMFSKTFVPAEGVLAVTSFVFRLRILPITPAIVPAVEVCWLVLAIAGALVPVWVRLVNIGKVCSTSRCNCRIWLEISSSE